MNWQPSNSIRELIAEFISNLITTTPEILGVSEIIPGCSIVDIPAGATPKVVTATIHEFHQKVMWRGVPPALTVGDVVTVAHLREGNVYEIIGASGAGGSTGAWDAQFLTLAAHALLDNERIFAPGTWLAGTDGGAGGNYTLDFKPDNPVLVSSGVATEYATIQAAITAASACDTVLIPPGTYNEDITLKANVCVKGLGPRDKIRITGDEDVVTTAQDGWLGNVTVIATDPPAGGGFRGTIDLAHATGDCTMRHVTIIMNCTANATGACGVATPADNNTGRLILEDVSIVVVNTVGGAAYGVLTDDDYDVLLRRFDISVTYAGGFAGGLAQMGDGDIHAFHGSIECNGTTEYDAYISTTCSGNIHIFSVSCDTSTLFGDITYMLGDRAGAVKDLTVTVGAAGMFATLQGAIDWFKGKVIVGTCIIDCDVAAYDEAVVFSELLITPGSSLRLDGDTTRGLAGISYVQGAICNPLGLASGGTFNNANRCTIATNPGLDQITVSGGTVDPDFTGWVNGDTIWVYDRSADTRVERTINQINPGGAGTNVIEITVALAAALGGSGDSICLVPSHSITRTVAGRCIAVDTVKGVVIRGWRLSPSTGASCDGLFVTSGGSATAYNCCSDAEDRGFYAALGYAALTVASGAISAWGCDYGYRAYLSSTVESQYSVAVDCNYGTHAMYFCLLTASFMVAEHCGYGYRAQSFSELAAYGAAAMHAVTTGYYVTDMSFVDAGATNVNNVANAADYSGASCVVHNCNSTISWS